VPAVHPTSQKATSTEIVAVALRVLTERLKHMDVSNICGLWKLDNRLATEIEDQWRSWLGRRLYDGKPWIVP
jgi:hypothetical protein